MLYLWNILQMGMRWDPRTEPWGTSVVLGKGWKQKIEVEQTECSQKDMIETCQAGFGRCP